MEETDPGGHNPVQGLCAMLLLQLGSWDWALTLLYF